MLLQLKKGLRHLFRKEDGSVTFLIGLGVTVLVASTGIAIDMGRVQVVQSRLSSALDAAGLAAGNGVNSGNAVTITNKYFWANFPLGFMGSSVNNPTVTANVDNSVLTLDVHGTVPTTFMKIFGIMQVPVQAHSQITRANMGMELVLVMDNTGSMTDPAGGGLNKLQAAKNASIELLNILYGSNATVPNMWIGIVPFTQSVNIGTNHGSWTPSTVLTWGPTSWAGCVEARSTGGEDVTDTPPGASTLFPKYYSVCNTDTDGNGPDTGTNMWYGSNGSVVPPSIPRYGNCVRSASTQYRTPLNEARGPNMYCPQALTALTANKNTLINAINAMQARGSTEIPLGMAWAWRMLSPNWRNLWGGEMDVNHLPLDYHAPLMSKVAILITDGDNNIDWDVYTAYGTPPGTTQLGANPCTSMSNCTNAETVLNTRTAQICSNMKAHGIIIYTIAFGTDISTTGQNLLRNCATSSDYYFYSPTGAALTTTFHQIGDSLANLRVSQ